jgi:hypothetical protein
VNSQQVFRSRGPVTGQRAKRRVAEDHEGRQAAGFGLLTPQHAQRFEQAAIDPFPRGGLDLRLSFFCFRRPQEARNDLSTQEPAALRGDRKHVEFTGL